ncbi:MAG TPA: hypothetical protein VGS03_04205 [Candidatus Polarisedimenticolia bacterium]|jgi:hypothetical protein|nr:hypothetical protein [Candidatus Polarisedimenticolia bacterium]
MRTDLNLTRLAALLAVTAILATGLACNEHDDPGQAENVVLVNSVTTAGTSVSAATDTTATVTYTLHPRNNGGPGLSADSFWHDLTLTSYSVSFEPAVIAPISGPVSTGFCPAGGTCSADVILVPNGSKPGAGTTVVAHIDFEGRDSNDNPVNFSADAAVTFIP